MSRGLPFTIRRAGARLRRLAREPRASTVGLILALLVPFSCLRTFAAQPPVDTTNPTAFFTNVAGRLLKAELNLDLQRIQICPTNQYTPVVHRLLQLTANIYDGTTNRSLSSYPYVPSVFRPLFRRLPAGQIVIAGYRQVTQHSGWVNPATAPVSLDLEAATNTSSIPAYGTPPGISDRIEPMVEGVPLIIGAKKGIPNFNELSMQTCVNISRLLQFRRDEALPPSISPIRETNQMYVASITNAFGIEAWNSYSNSYPRQLEMIAAIEMTAVMTNEFGERLLTNTAARGVITNIPGGQWTGWTGGSASSSFILPWDRTNQVTFLPNSTYSNAYPWFVPQTHTFEAGSGFYVPKWILNLHTKAKFILFDTEAQRIVDYVSLSRSEPPLDVFTKLSEGADCSTIIRPNPANLWCTNRLRGSNDLSVPTYGIFNQMFLCLHGNEEDWSKCQMDPTVGQDPYKAVDFFRINFGFSPRFHTGTTFYRSNVFYAPFAPYRPIYIHTSWQANDPLVHYTINGLLDLGVNDTNRVDFASRSPALENLGALNPRYGPWGGYPGGLTDPYISPFDPSVKDPSVVKPDDWDFPSSLPLEIQWIGRVHRGTPWQTLFLKSTNFFSFAHPYDYYRLWMSWQYWIGVPDPFHALAMAPANDWRIASLLSTWFTTNHPASRTSVNQHTANHWTTVLDGLIAFTNTAPFQLEPVVISSNSPQATLIAEALHQTRLAQPGGVVRIVGDLLRTPELSMGSPWLNAANGGITDAAYEVLPLQMLAYLRPDSIGSIKNISPFGQIQFTGFEGYPYVIEFSTNLVDWSALATFYPTNGLFELVVPLGSLSTAYYRSGLLP